LYNKLSTEPLFVWQGGWLDPSDLQLSYQNLLARRQALAQQAAASLTPTPDYPLQVLYKVLVTVFHIREMAVFRIPEMTVFRIPEMIREILASGFEIRILGFVHKNSGFYPDPEH
jgi:hypothetical protein